MPPSKYRIPRVAAAALAFGACGDDSAVDASASRARAVTESYCRQYAMCYPDEFPESYDSIGECADALEDILREYANDNEECLDSYLDYYECLAKLPCGDDSDACAAEAGSAEELCPDVNEDYLTRSPQPASFKSFRIPR